MMGFDVFGPTRHVRASNEDDGGETPYDIPAMPGEYGLHCPQLEKLHRRFYETTLLRYADGHVAALRDELRLLQQTYRARREPGLEAERRVSARDPHVRRAILDRVLQEDVIYRVLEEFRLLCEEAIVAHEDVRCVGD